MRASSRSCDISRLVRASRDCARFVSISTRETEDMYFWTGGILYTYSYLSIVERRLPVMQFHVAGRGWSSARLQIYAFLLALLPRRNVAVLPASGNRIMLYEKRLVWKCNITGDIGAGMRLHAQDRDVVVLK